VSVLLIVVVLSRPAYGIPLPVVLPQGSEVMIYNEREITTMESVMYRQGDVLFTKIEKAPEGLTQRKTQIIVEGEATGHHHSLVDGRILGCMVIWS
jgi:hypothetical protein